MVISDRAARTIGTAAWYAGFAALLLGPVHALARYATADGAEDMESPIVRAWAEPAARFLRPVLDWSDPQTVYVTYGKLWLILLGPAALCALAVRGRRGSVRGVERIGWWIALPAYALMTLSVLGDYWTPWLDESFLFLGLPGMVLGMIGSVVLGIGLLRRGFRPKATGWLLILFPPLLFGLSAVFALGAALLPMLWAWGLAGRRMSAQIADEPAAVNVLS